MSLAGLVPSQFSFLYVCTADLLLQSTSTGYSGGLSLLKWVQFVRAHLCDCLPTLLDSGGSKWNFNQAARPHQGFGLIADLVHYVFQQWS